MRIISNLEANCVAGAMALIQGPFSYGPNGMTFGPGFVLTVTDSSKNLMGNFHAYPNKVVDASTGKVLFDGTQNAFCFNGSAFQVQAVQGGHAYIFMGTC